MLNRAIHAKHQWGSNREKVGHVNERPAKIVQTSRWVVKHKTRVAWRERPLTAPTAAAMTGRSSGLVVVLVVSPRHCLGTVRHTPGHSLRDGVRNTAEDAAADHIRCVGMGLEAARVPDPKTEQPICLSAK